jgi:ribokinase
MCYNVGSKIEVKNIKTDIGGGGTNTATSFSRLGLKTGWIGNLGNDSNGKEILDLLKREKIKFLGKILKKEKTDQSIILDSKQHNRTILIHKGINNKIEKKDVKKFKTNWLYLTSLSKTSFKTQKQLAEKLIKKGTKIAFNPGEHLIKNTNILSLLRITHVLILNKEEAQLLTKEKDLLKGLSKLGPKIIVITDKNKKISCYDGKKKYFLSPNKVKVVERTGAGDAFASSFVAGLIKNRPIPYCLKLGLKNSESVIKHFGAKNNLIKKWPV